MPVFWGARKMERNGKIWEFFPIGNSQKGGGGVAQMPTWECSQKTAFSIYIIFLTDNIFRGAILSVEQRLQI